MNLNISDVRILDATNYYTFGSLCIPQPGSVVRHQIIGVDK
jgi:hypothetical protein